MDVLTFLKTVFAYELSGEQFTVLAISSVLLLVSSIIGLTRCFHMLQQNSYFNIRYLGWCKGAKKGRGIFAFFVFLVVDILLCYEVLNFYPVLVLSAIIFVVRLISNIKQQKKSIKPLVFTARVKRLYATPIIVSAGLIVLFFVYRKSISFLAFYSSVLIFMLPVYAMLINLVNRPIEKWCATYFVNDAKRIIKKHPEMKVVGITGSYGKTSTKFILGRILSEKYNVTVTPENYNTTMGVVRTIREHLKKDTEIFVCEMGAKRKNDISKICKIVKPNFGIITSIGPQHLNTFGKIETIVSTKFELADAVEHINGTMFLNYDNALIKEEAETRSCNIVSSGHENADYIISNVTGSAAGCSFDLVHDGETINLKSRLLGSFNIQNIAVAVSMAKALGVSNEQIRYAVSSLKPVEHRLELKSFIGGSLMIDDAYNANPSGSLESINVIGQFDGFRKIVITPGLVELGEKEYECNFNLGKKVAEICDEIYFVGGDRTKPLTDGAASVLEKQDKVHVVMSFKEAVACISAGLDKNTVVLVENDLPDNYLN